jgi:hypothetical protein
MRIAAVMLPLAAVAAVTATAWAYGVLRLEQVRVW